MENIFLYLNEIKEGSEYSIAIGRSGDYLYTPGGKTVKSSTLLGNLHGKALAIM